MPHLVARTKELQLQPRYSPQQMVIVIYKRLLQNVQEHLQVDRRIAESLEVYRKASHRDLCQKITAALPREIRDIIYRHVNTATYTAVGPNRPTERYRTAAHVGGTIAYEMAESWYRTSLFTVYENDKEAKRCSETGLLLSSAWGSLQNSWSRICGWCTRLILQEQTSLILHQGWCHERLNTQIDW
jgi:hypothetical protein